MEILHIMAQIPEATGGALPWVGGAGVTGLLGWLFWQERGDRKAAEERERATYKEYSDRISKEVSTLEKTGQLMMELRRQG